MRERIDSDTAYKACAVSRTLFGFTTDPEIALWENSSRILGQVPVNQYFSQPKTLAFHNLCMANTALPPGVATTLGLGLKYCIESPKPQSQAVWIQKSLRRFARSIRIHKTVRDRDSADNGGISYIPGLYIASNWNPKRVDRKTESCLAQFEAEINRKLSLLPRRKHYNLSPSQRRCLSQLRQRNDLVIFPTDKNLGPSVTNRTPYIEQALSEHLMNETNYEYIEPALVKSVLEDQMKRFQALYKKYRYSLPTEAERTYFQRAFHPSYLEQTRVPQFYGAFKVHKAGKAKMRPIVSCVNSIPEIVSKWIDYWLKAAVRDTKLASYLRDVEHLLKDLATEFPNGLPPNARLFSMDAVGMYANIDTDHGIEQVAKYLHAHSDSLPSNMPIPFLVEALREVMSNNIIQFGDTFWRQKSGCAMGTSTAVNYSYLYVGSLETFKLLATYQKNFLYYKRFIDDVIGVWLPDPDAPDSWNRFLEDINDFGKLKWTTTGFTNHLVFMDLEIRVMENGRIHTRTYQKELNLYLYIPPGSAHPRNMLRGLVFGRLRAYKLQNSDHSDFVHFASLLGKRLRDRGWPPDILVPIFREAWQRLQNSESTNHHKTPQGSISKKQVFFHLPYHPRGIQRSDIRDAFQHHLAEILDDCRLTIAVSRPKNIGDRVCSTVLPDLPGKNPSDHI